MMIPANSGNSNLATVSTATAIVIADMIGVGVFTFVLVRVLPGDLRVLPLDPLRLPAHEHDQLIARHLFRGRHLIISARPNRKINITDRHTRPITVTLSEAPDCLRTLHSSLVNQ